MKMNTPIDTRTFHEEDDGLKNEPPAVNFEEVLQSLQKQERKQKIQYQISGVITIILFLLMLFGFSFLSTKAFIIGILIVVGCGYFFTHWFKKTNEKAKFLTELNEKIELTRRKVEADSVKKLSPENYFSLSPNFEPVVQTTASWDLFQLSKFIIAFVLTIAVFINWGLLAGLVVGFILFILIGSAKLQ